MYRIDQNSNEETGFNRNNAFNYICIYMNIIIINNDNNYTKCSHKGLNT